jgi:hypothetical protein
VENLSTTPHRPHVERNSFRSYQSHWIRAARALKNNVAGGVLDLSTTKRKYLVCGVLYHSRNLQHG